MFKSEFLHELKSWGTRPITYFYLLVFFCLGTVTFCGSMGYFDELPDSQIKSPWINSPFGVNNVLLYFQKIMLILLPTIIGSSLYKDFQKQAHSLIYSLPLIKSAYLGGRFLASFAVVVGISLFVVSGFILAEHSSGLNPNLHGPFRLNSYGYSLFFYLLPNWLVFGLLAFAAVMLTRKILVCYLILLTPFLIQLITENIFSGNGYLIALLDPFGGSVAQYHQQYFDLDQRNVSELPISSLLILNRVLWVGLSLLFFLFAYRKFQFTEQIEPLFSIPKYFKQERTNVRRNHLPSGNQLIAYDFGILYQLRALHGIFLKSLYQIVRNPIFWMLTSLGLVAVFFIILRVTQLEDFVLVPATQLMLGSPLIIFSMIVLVLSFVFSGLILQSEHQLEMGDLLAVTPISNAIFLTGKLFGVLGMQLVMLTSFGIMGVTYEYFSGYSGFNLSLLSYGLFVRSWIPLVSWTVLAFCIHILFRNFYLSLFLIVIGWIGIQGLSSVGISSYLLRFNEFPKLVYSEFHGFGPLESSYFLLVFYWLFFSLSLFVVYTGFYQIHRRFTNKESLLDTLSGLKKGGWIAVLIPACITIGLGFTVWKGEQGSKRSNNESKGGLIDFKKEFEQFQSLPQPRISSLSLTVDIFPENQIFELSGIYELVNKNPAKLDTLLIRCGFDEQTTLILGDEYESLAYNDFMKTHLIKLKRSLMPGDSLQLAFQVKSTPNTQFSVNSNVHINGTYLTQDILPRLGYLFDSEIPTPDSNSIFINHYQAIDADRVKMDFLIRTSADQVAIAPGELLAARNEGKRAFYHYRHDGSKLIFNINSGHYRQKKIQRGEKLLEIYYLHDRMIGSLADGFYSAMDIGERHFGEARDSVFRVIEFPISFGTHATLSGNNLLISETRFLAASNSDDKTTDIAFYVAAHETFHYWWGNVLIPARAKGATMLTESITEYLMLRLLQHKKGEEAMLAFKELQQKRYLRGRSDLVTEEPPLALVMPDQSFISYGKGAIAFFELSERIGEDRFLDLLTSFKANYQTTYPTSQDFINFIKKHLTPEEQSLLIQKLLEVH